MAKPTTEELDVLQFGRVLHERPAPTWDKCEHEWRARGDFDLGGNRTEVECVKCQCPGEHDDKTGDVFWPAT